MATEMPPLKPVFPLPKGYFGAVNLTTEQQARCCDIVRMRLGRALADEFEFVHADRRQVNSAKWRLVTKRRQLRIYRRTANNVTGDEDTSRPSMLSVGRMEGSLEDVLYGSYDKTHEELQATMAIYCFMCRSTSGMFSSLRTCRVCGITVCAQCRVKRAVFIGPARTARSVTCCRRCIKEAKTMDIRPAEPGFSILGEQHLPTEGDWSNSNSDGPPEERTPLSDEHIDDFPDDLSELDVDNYRFSNDSGYSEDEVEKIIASMAAATAPGAALDDEEKQNPGDLVNGDTLTREQAAIFQKIRIATTLAAGTEVGFRVVQGAHPALTHTHTARARARLPSD
ncbi:hypothetical protein PybrP1_006603 [[Pythium] brassicae (nom. inval.)]|nr:hypothetical protein PybrP1_006603 [[Pythium] brassicae (nom. inval.)]